MRRQKKPKKKPKKKQKKKKKKTKKKNDPGQKCQKKKKTKKPNNKEAPPGDLKITTSIIHPVPNNYCSVET